MVPVTALPTIHKGWEVKLAMRPNTTSPTTARHKPHPAMSLGRVGSVCVVLIGLSMCVSGVTTRLVPGRALVPIERPRLYRQGWQLRGCLYGFLCGLGQHCVGNAGPVGYGLYVVRHVLWIEACVGCAAQLGKLLGVGVQNILRQ